MKRSSVLFITVVLALSAAPLLRAQSVYFSQVSSAVNGDDVAVSNRERQRIERFLSAVFPMKPMKRLEHTSDRPISRRASYSVISQDGTKFVLVGVTARWEQTLNVLAIYRMEDGAPHQVWRSKPWEGSYYGLHFQTAKAGNKTVVLFQEGGADNDFGLASVFTFQNDPKGLIVRDLTPSLPWLRAYTHFPMRPLYGKAIALRMQNDDLLLDASDQDYNILANTMRQSRTWKYNAKRGGRFERLQEAKQPGTRMTNIGMRNVTGR
jgi:hypothetical protein